MMTTLKNRRERVPVVWVQHSDEQLVRGSDAWQIVPELTPGDGEPLVEKLYGDSFEDTTLKTVLSGLGVGRLVVAGAQTDACIRRRRGGRPERSRPRTSTSGVHPEAGLAAHHVRALGLVSSLTRDPGRVNRGGTSTHREVEMGSHHEPEAKRHEIQDLIRLVTIGLAVAAVVKELRTPPADRHWHGIVAGFVPYDFRAPTFARFKERVWAPDSTHLINPRPFGVGWTVNVGRAVALVRQKVSAAG
jgi:hypothetical protein